MDKNFDHQMSLSKRKCLYSYSCLCFLKRAVPLTVKQKNKTINYSISLNFRTILLELFSKKSFSRKV